MILLCHISLMGMASVVMTLLLLVQLPRISASGLQQYRSTSLPYQIRYVADSNQKLFYINGILVDQYLFCKALRFHCTKHCFFKGYAKYHECGLYVPLGALRFHCTKHCFFKGYAKYHECGLYVPLDKFHFKAGRKLLQKDVREGSIGHDSNQGTQRIEDKSANIPPLTPKHLAIAVPAMFVLCCALLCPCFQARRKESERAVLVKEPNSMDSISSVEMNSVPEKIPPSPLRVPPSPLRVPPSPRFSLSPQLDRVGSVHLNMSQVARATQNFSPSQIIGEGGFGTVYKAQLPDGQIVAIKRAKKEQFDGTRTEFRSEVELLAKIDHRNLVKLLGYVDKGNELLLITEYVPNGTLREHLDGLRGKILDFNQRLEISIDVAHGLTYLHMYSEKQIIHRDVKSSNILLTERMRAKVADFGFARLGDMDSDKTHVSTKVKGTVGYLDPEYMKTYRLTPKSDVYSFGVLLLEMITGRRPVEVKRPPDERVTLRWAFRKYAEGSIMEMVDPRMKEAVHKKILMKMFALAIQCAAPTRADRPDMKTVGEQLWGVRMDYLRTGTRE